MRARRLGGWKVVRVPVFAVFLVVAGLVGATPAVRDIGITPEKVEVGRQIFAICQPCHGMTGEGLTSTGPRLNSTTFLAGASDDMLRQTITHGRTGTPMVNWETTYSPEQIESVIAFIRSWQEVEPADLDDSPLTGNAANGEQLFGPLCASCHGRRGEGFEAGSSGSGIGGRGVLDVVSDGYLRYIVREGKTLTAMRPYRFGSAMTIADLTDQEIDDIIVYLRANAW